MANILLIADHDNNVINTTTFSAVTAAEKLGEIDILTVGYECKDLTEDLFNIRGIRKVILVDNVNYQHQLAENTADLIVSIGKDYDYIIAPSTSASKNILPRVAALLDTQMTSDIIEIINEDTFIRPIYSGSALSTIKLNEKIKILTVHPTAFESADIGNNTAEIEVLNITDKLGEDRGLSSLIEKETHKADRPDVYDARIVIGVGRSLKNPEMFKLIEQLADKLGAAIGGTRPACENTGFIYSDNMIGQSGKIIAPDLYIGIGVSGSVQHISGIKDSKVIVAINNDPEAPIFQVADYGLVEDLSVAIPEIIKILS